MKYAKKQILVKSANLSIQEKKYLYKAASKITRLIIDLELYLPEKLASKLLKPDKDSPTLFSQIHDLKKLFSE